MLTLLLSVFKAVMQPVSGLTTLAVVILLTFLRYASIKLMTFKKGGLMGSYFETLWTFIISATATSLLP
jgi:hypothetical protein